MKYTITALFLLSAIFSMGQKDFTARTWASMDRAIYKQQRQIDSLLARTEAQDRELHKLTMSLGYTLQGAIRTQNSVIEQGIRLDTLEEKCVEMDCEIFNRQHVLEYTNIKALQNDLGSMALRNFIFGIRLDSLIKDLRDRPALRMGLQEGPIFRDPPIWQDGWGHLPILTIDSAGNFTPFINRNPATFYSAQAGDTLYNWGRDRSFSPPVWMPISGEGYTDTLDYNDQGAAKDPPTGYYDPGAVIDPATTPSLSMPPVKKKVHHKKKVKKKQLYIIGTQDQWHPKIYPVIGGDKVLYDTIRSKKK